MIMYYGKKHNPNEDKVLQIVFKFCIPDAFLTMFSSFNNFSAYNVKYPKSWPAKQDWFRVKII